MKHRSSRSLVCKRAVNDEGGHGASFFYIASWFIHVRRLSHPRPEYFKYMKLKVDAVSNPLIMRPTSSDIGTRNSLRFNELASSGGAERATIE
ncbi:hypothetical protein FH041_20515 [Pseudomonas sp. SWI7]|nr:hypothetical protein FH041_20515 [Pseudomonas sp. SWI7]